MPYFINKFVNSWSFFFNDTNKFITIAFIVHNAYEKQDVCNTKRSE